MSESEMKFIRIDWKVKQQSEQYRRNGLFRTLQMGVMGGGWNGSNSGGAWASRPGAREHPRYPADCRPVKVHTL